MFMVRKFKIVVKINVCFTLKTNRVKLSTTRAYYRLRLQRFQFGNPIPTLLKSPWLVLISWSIFWIIQITHSHNGCQTYTSNEDCCLGMMQIVLKVASKQVHLHNTKLKKLLAFNKSLGTTFHTQSLFLKNTHNLLLLK